MKIKVLKAISVLATLSALVSASVASLWLAYQPKEPKCLRK